VLHRVTKEDYHDPSNDRPPQVFGPSRRIFFPRSFLILQAALRIGTPD
jgi:hypothetical protein